MVTYNHIECRLAKVKKYYEFFYITTYDIVPIMEVITLTRNICMLLVYYLLPTMATVRCFGLCNVIAQVLDKHKHKLDSSLINPLIVLMHTLNFFQVCPYVIQIHSFWPFMWFCYLQKVKKPCSFIFLFF